MKQTRSHPPIFLISSLLLIAWSILILLFADNIGSPIRFFNDYSDRLVYAARGSWILSGKTPYVEAFCEYPQIAMIFFSLPYALLIAFFPSAWPITIYYLVIYQFLILLTALGTLCVLSKLIGAEHRWLLLLFVLPASIYFIYNRFDILPAFISILSLYLFTRKKILLAVIVLACGVMVKWYLLLLLPVYLISYVPLTLKQRIVMAAGFGLTILAFLVPTFLLGGMEAVLMPYTFHLDRGIESGSLLYFAGSFLYGLSGININQPWVMRVFFLLQFSAVPLALFVRLHTPGQVMRFSAVSIIIFLLFAKFYSPQWWLWLLPLLIPLASKRLDTFLIIGFDVITYLGFPVLYDLFSPGSKIYISIALIQAIFLLVIACRLTAGDLLEDNRFSRLLLRKRAI